MSDESESESKSESESESESDELSSVDELEEGLSLSGSVEELEDGSEGSDGTAVEVSGLSELAACCDTWALWGC